MVVKIPLGNQQDKPLLAMSGISYEFQVMFPLFCFQNTFFLMYIGK